MHVDYDAVTIGAISAMVVAVIGALFTGVMQILVFLRAGRAEVQSMRNKVAIDENTLLTAQTGEKTSDDMQEHASAIKERIAEIEKILSSHIGQDERMLAELREELKTINRS